MRHNAITNYVARSLDQKGFSVVKEKTFTTTNGKLKPDIVAFSPDMTLVIDTQIVNDHFPLKVANQNNIEKYLPLKNSLILSDQMGFMV